jgi:hypothetical protein
METNGNIKEPIPLSILKLLLEHTKNSQNKFSCLPRRFGEKEPVLFEKQKEHFWWKTNKPPKKIATEFPQHKLENF